MEKERDWFQLPLAGKWEVCGLGSRGPLDEDRADQRGGQGAFGEDSKRVNGEGGDLGMGRARIRPRRVVGDRTAGVVLVLLEKGFSTIAMT